MVSWEQLCKEMKPDCVGGKYIAYYRGVHYEIGVLEAGGVRMTPEGEKWAEKFAVELAKVIHKKFVDSAPLVQVKPRAQAQQAALTPTGVKPVK